MHGALIFFVFVSGLVTDVRWAGSAVATIPSVAASGNAIISSGVNTAVVTFDFNRDYAAQAGEYIFSTMARALTGEGTYLVPTTGAEILSMEVVSMGTVTGVPTPRARMVVRILFRAM